MDKFNRIINILWVQFATLGSMMVAHLGYMYDTAGEGLNPMAAYPLATLLIVAPVASWRMFK